MNSKPVNLSTPRTTVVTLREPSRATGPSPQHITMVIDDKPRQFARVMEAIEQSEGFVRYVILWVRRKGLPQPLAEIEVVLDTTNGVPIYAVGAAIERKLGRWVSFVNFAEAAGHPGAEGGERLFPRFEYQQLIDCGELRIQNLRCKQFSFFQPVPLFLTQGPPDPGQALKTLQGVMMPMSSVFHDAHLRKALECRPMFIESRFAWALGSFGGNLEYCHAEIQQSPSGHQQRFVQIVVSFPSRGLPVMAAANTVVEAMCQIFRLRRGPAPE
ncbi:MAG: hypothetical protein ACKVS8_10965 [Phycisphaerales bacterium]